MKRILEPELMEDAGQALAYANADFSAAHQHYVDLFAEEFPDRPKAATVLDIGCGPGDVTIRFARANPQYRFHAVDGSTAMLRCARRVLKRSPALTRRIRLIEGLIPSVRLPRPSYDVIISTSLLHHLPDPDTLWQMVRQYSHTGTLVFIADLCRPSSRARARRLVAEYSSNEPEVLRRDFYNSLLAAFTPTEVRKQLAKAGLGGLAVSVITNRHLNVSGRIS